MSSAQNQRPSAPADTADRIDDSEATNYDTMRGCLFMGVAIAVGMALVAALIVLFGTPGE